MGKWKNKTKLGKGKKWGNGRNEDQISKQAAIVELLAPENNSHWRGRQCRHQQ
jgi:hypothetical protein